MPSSLKQKKIKFFPDQLTKSPWSLLIKKKNLTFMCLYLLLRWEAAVTGVLGQTSPCPEPEEQPSSQMLLSCKFRAVTPLIHMTTHSSRQVLQLVCVSMELSALLSKIQVPKASIPSTHCTEGLVRFLLTATAGNAQDQQKLFSCLVSDDRLT